MGDKVTFFNAKSLINCNGKLIDLSKPLIMGILNITPDSFYDGNKYKNNDEIINRVGKMLDEGADIIDIGAVSTRPGADILTEDIEKERLMPVLKLINSDFPGIIISVDTFRSKIAQLAVNEYDVSLINDISGGTLDDSMFKTIADLQVPYILMHIKGNPQNMQSNPEYNNLFDEIFNYFSSKISVLKESGINDIIIDPGFGFGKTLEQNYEILKKIDLFKIFQLPILAGFSRKSMVTKLLNNTPEKALNGTTVLNTIALIGGANILRVHDVREAKEVITIYNKYLNSDVF